MSTFSRVDCLPPYVFKQMAQFKAEAQSRGVDVIDLGLGNPDRPTPERIVEKLKEAAGYPEAHRYSEPRGIPVIRKAMANWYERRYNVSLDYDDEIIMTIGSKEGLSHLALAISGSGDKIIVPDPCYPIHAYGFIIAGAEVISLPLNSPADFLNSMKETIENTWPKPKAMLLNFPSNPTADCVDLAFFEEVVALARHYKIWVIHDLAYADIVFDDYKAPSILQVPGAKDIAVETYSLSKSYNMPGWRVGFVAGNKELIAALARIKSYLDYGTFTPIQIAAATALEECDDCIEDIRLTYQHRRDVLCDGLNQIGWQVKKPKATMFLWASIPAEYQHMGSIEWCKYLINEAGVALSPGVGFGAHGESHVRLSLVENEQRCLHVIHQLKSLFLRDGILEAV